MISTALCAVSVRYVEQPSLEWCIRALEVTNLAIPIGIPMNPTAPSSAGPATPVQLVREWFIHSIQVINLVIPIGIPIIPMSPCSPHPHTPGTLL